MGENKNIMQYTWANDSFDKEASERLSSFLPEKIFDFHAHIYRVSDLNLSDPGLWTDGPAEVTISVWRQYLSEFLGNEKLAGGLFFPAPSPKCNINEANRFLAAQVKKENFSAGLALVSPDMTMGELKMFLDQPDIYGMKPYHFFSSERPTFESSIRGFLPEWQWELANSYRSIVMLHLVKSEAVADKDNLREIRDMCTRYPNIKLILAHAGRSFSWPNAREGIRALRGFDNIWFDTSAICEPEAFIEILREFGPGKLLWGSDFPICQTKGRCVTIGNGFAWLDNDFCRWEKSSFAKPVIVGIESLRALQWSCEETGLNSEDVRDIFYNNAVRLLNLHEKNEYPAPVVEAVNRTDKLYRHAKQRIPGGTQLLSKRPEMMAPGRWPAYFREARGCEVWDLDGNHYFDMATNGIGSCLLGFNDPDVNKALRRRINLGSMCTLNSPEEVELADMLCEIHPWADQVRFTRSGGESCAVAVRIARATTNRSVIAVCGYHGWHDWYLAANLGEDDALKGHLLPGLNPLGVPVELRNTAFTFRLNDREGLKELIRNYGPRLAAVIMEPCRNADPEPGFLEFVREATRKCGALLIFDEITIGWRLHYGGAHLKFGVVPDIAVFAKALGNGTPIGAVIGTKAAMEGANISFISSTYWTESLGPVAALATLKKMERYKVPEHIALIGESVMSSWRELAGKHNLPVTTSGYPCLAHFAFDHEDSEKLRTLYTILMLKRGFLAGLSIYPTLAHRIEIVQKYQSAIDEVFGEIAEAVKNDTVDRIIGGNIAHSGFARLL